MAGTTRALTPSGTTSFPPTVAPDTPTSLTSQPASTNTLAPIAAAASNLRASSSPKSQKALSPQFSSRPLTGAAALEDQRRLREQQERAAASSTRTSPNPNIAAISNLLAQSSARSGPPNPTEQMAQMAQKIHIPESGQHDTMQTSPVSMSSIGSLDTTTGANASTTAPIMAPAMPATAENPFPNDDPHAPRPAVDAGVPTDSRAFTFPPPPADDPRNPHRNMSLPTAGMSSPRSTSAKRHKCPYCSTVFTRHHNLKSHLLTHSQEKPYECQQCQSRFRRLHDLKRHTKLHTGERPHECPKCGRKFARGDALARHNKGQGGCAGRRSSFGVDPDDVDGRPGDHMAGIEYTAEPDQMDEDGGSRRGSEVTRSRQDSGAYRAGPSTYPPPAIGPQIRGPGQVAPMYPPNGPPPHRDTLSPHSSNLTATNNFPPGGPSVFQGSVTESPKPLSPGQPGSHRGSASGPASHAFSYSNRGSGPQLPPLPPMHQSMPPPGSQPGSLSSGGSAASTREILQRDGDWRQWESDQRMQKMQEDNLANLARMQSDHSRLETGLRAEITKLESENKALKDALRDSRDSQDFQIKRLQEELAAMKAAKQRENAQ